MATLTASVRTLLSFYHQHPKLAEHIKSFDAQELSTPRWELIFEFVFASKPRSGSEDDGVLGITDKRWDELFIKRRMLTAHRIVHRRFMRQKRVEAG